LRIPWEVSLGTITAIVQKAGQRAQSWLVQQELQAEVKPASPLSGCLKNSDFMSFSIQRFSRTFRLYDL